MQQFLKDMALKYAKDFGYTADVDEDTATIVTQFGSFGFKVIGEDELKLLLASPIDDNDDDQIASLVKVRKHFSGALGTAVKDYKASKEAQAEPPVEPPATKGPAAKTTLAPEEKLPEMQKGISGTKAAGDKARGKKKTPSDPTDAPIEPDVPAASNEPEVDSIRPEFDGEGQVFPEIFATIIKRAETLGLEVKSKTVDELALEGDFGTATVDKDGNVKSDNANLKNALEGKEIKKKTPAPTAPTPAPQAPAANTPASTPKAPGKTCIYDQIVAHFGPDLMEVFGETGTMKSKGMVALAAECAKAGRKVYYLDTENNLSPKDIAMLRSLNVEYKYTPVLKEIDEIVEKKIPGMKVDLIIIDSVGMPVLRKFSNMSAHDRGSALLDIIKWLGTLKEWTYINKTVAFVTNQPQSEFGKTNPNEKGDHRMPFGDKSNFIPGALLLAKKTLDSKEGSKANFQVYRLRDHAWGEVIFTVEASKTGTNIKLVCEV